MATIVTRAGKGTPLTHDEVDANFTNLNTDKIETSAIGVTVQAYDAELDAWAAIATSSKQDTLVSATNIKTINGDSILGAGDLVVSGGSMVYPGAGIALSDGTGWLTSITDNSANWNTAFGWGDHATAGYLDSGDIGVSVQAYDAQLADVAGLTPTDNGVIIGNGTNFVVESGATLKTSLGLTIGTDVQAYDADTAKLDVAQSWTATQTFKGLGETVAALSGTTPSISVANGTILTWTLTGNSSPTDGLSDAQSVQLEIDDGTAYTITWPSVTWKTNGGSPPTLKTTGITTIILYKVGSVLYGARVGDA